MSDMEQQVVDAVMGFVVKELLDGDAGGLTPTTNLLDAGLINSKGLVLLTAFITERFGLRVPFKQLTPEALKTPKTIAALILRARGAPG